MSTDLKRVVVEKLQTLTEEQQREVLAFTEWLRRKVTLLERLGELIGDCFKDVPQEVIDKLPADASSNLDYYLYGASKNERDFVDTHYFVARISPKDQWHERNNLLCQ